MKIFDTRWGIAGYSNVTFKTRAGLNRSVCKQSLVDLGLAKDTRLYEGGKIRFQAFTTRPALPARKLKVRAGTRDDSHKVIDFARPDTRQDADTWEGTTDMDRWILRAVRVLQFLNTQCKGTVKDGIDDGKTRWPVNTHVWVTTEYK